MPLVTRMRILQAIRREIGLHPFFLTRVQNCPILLENEHRAMTALFTDDILPMGLDRMHLTTWMTQRMELQCCNCSSALYHGLRYDASDYLDDSEDGTTVLQLFFCSMPWA
jgi:hypothetical protein